VVIDRRVHRCLNAGVYADVFEVEGFAFKAFRSGPDLPPRQTREGRRKVFENQCEAYRLLTNDPWLQGHCATFYGERSLVRIIGEDGEDDSSRFLLDCCYCLELLDGTEKKANDPCRRAQTYRGGWAPISDHQYSGE
jgi:hypothetical protein